MISVLELQSRTHRVQKGLTAVLHIRDEENPATEGLYLIVIRRYLQHETSNVYKCEFMWFQICTQYPGTWTEVPEDAAWEKG